MSSETLKLISAIADAWEGRAVMSSSFGAESAALIHMVIQHVPRIRIITVDTGFLFPQTQRFMEELRRRFDLNILVYRGRVEPDEYLRKAGESDPLFRCDIDRCCAVNKNEAFERAMRELRPQAWIRGIRRRQASTRADRKAVEWSDRYQCYAISPLLEWTTGALHDYLREHGLPLHPLYEEGYASIGCQPHSCTRPIQIGQDARAGRWAGAGKLECGLHLETAP